MRQGRVDAMGKTDKTWRYEIGERINQLVLMSRKNNVEIAEAIGVTKETIRLWREGTNWPRMDKIKALAEVLTTTPDFILLGVQAEKKGMDLRERICRNDAELALLRLFRASNREGKNLTIEAARSYSITHPAPHNIVQLKDRRKG